MFFIQFVVKSASKTSFLSLNQKFGGHPITTDVKSKITANVYSVCKFMTTRTVRESDYSTAIYLSEQKDKLVTATGDTEKYSEKQANKVWLNSV